MPKRGARWASAGGSEASASIPGFELEYVLVDRSKAEKLFRIAMVSAFREAEVGDREGSKLRSQMLRRALPWAMLARRATTHIVEAESKSELVGRSFGWRWVCSANGRVVVEYDFRDRVRKVENL